LSKEEELELVVEELGRIKTLLLRVVTTLELDLLTTTLGLELSLETELLMYNTLVTSLL